MQSDIINTEITEKIKELTRRTGKSESDIMNDLLSKGLDRMSKKQRVGVAFRLLEETNDLLRNMAKDSDRSMTQVIEDIIHDAGKRPQSITYTMNGETFDSLEKLFGWLDFKHDIIITTNPL